jgi:hypothetical protein
MTSRAWYATSRGRLATVMLLVAVIGFLGWNAYQLAAAYREFTGLSQRLPNLPPVHAATHRREPPFPVKVWLHRVNSVERAARMARRYQGLEIDVVYDSGAADFDVGHPPVPSVGLSLDRLFAAVPDITNHYFWLDFKNLTDRNAQAACGTLLSIARERGIVSHVIVESTNPRALACFTVNGFYTSYYLFPDLDPHTMAPDQLRKSYEEVRANLAAGDVNAVSSSYRSLPFIDAYLPDSDILLWYLEPKGSLRYHAALVYLERNPRVKVILVKEYSRGYR